LIDRCQLVNKEYLKHFYPRRLNNYLFPDKKLQSVAQKFNSSEACGSICRVSLYESHAIVSYTLTFVSAMIAKTSGKLE